MSATLRECVMTPGKVTSAATRPPEVEPPAGEAGHHHPTPGVIAPTVEPR